MLFRPERTMFHFIMQGVTRASMLTLTIQKHCGEQVRASPQHGLPGQGPAMTTKECSQ
jgi:hypothetical protein